MLRKLFLRERMKTKRARRKAQVAFICIAFFLSLGISPISFAQDFTAKTIGDYGNVAVMEVTGNYDSKNPDGSVNEIPRQVIAREFFKTHKDVYDFLVIFSNFDFKMPDSEAKAFYYHVKNDVRGIGLNDFDDAALFGSVGSFRVWWIWGISSLVVDPLDPEFEAASFLLSHEIVHRWGAYVKFKDKDGNISNALLSEETGRTGASCSIQRPRFFMGTIGRTTEWDLTSVGAEDTIVLSIYTSWAL
jgi:hypothetical protein